MIEIDDGFRLTTGKEFYANNGILGLSPMCPALFEGYDGTVDDGTVLTDAERHEVAEYMISVWRAWAEPRSSEETN